jgi:DNA-binding response OmpR family regulator
MARKPDTAPQDTSLLVVEDEQDQLIALVEALQQHGYKVTGIDGGQKAIDILDSGEPGIDLMLLNYIMPGMDGYQTLEKLREMGIIDMLPIIMTGKQDETQALVRCIEIGADDYMRKPIDPILLQLRIQAALARYDIEATQRMHLHKVEEEKQLADDLLSVVIPIGVALSAEKDFDRLLELMLLETKRLCNADAGTLYLRTEDDLLNFMVVLNDTLGIQMGGTNSEGDIPFPPLRLYEEGTHAPNHRNVATHVALTGESFNIADAYSETDDFDFSGTIAFDQKSHYHSKSFLTVPIKNADSRTIGVLQLINARHKKTGEIVAFEPDLKQITESLAALAAVALESYVREQGLRKQIEDLKIEIDQVKRQQQVSEITQSGEFKSLKARAQAIRDAAKSED